MSTFKPGDKVRRLSGGVEHWGVVKGGIYTVREHFSAHSLALVENDTNTFDGVEFELVNSSLEDELRTNYPQIYDDLVSMGRFDLKPREDDVYTVTIRTAASNMETVESITDYLKGYVNGVPGQHLVNVKKEG